MTREIKAAASGSVLAIGKRGENETVRVIFPMLAEADEVVVLHRRHGDEHPYAVEISTTDDGVIWLVSLADVAIPGIGAAEVIYKNGGKVAKSVTYTTRTAESVDDGETITPTAAESWVQRVVDLTAEAQSAAGSAETSAGNAANSAESAENAAASAAESAETARGYTEDIGNAVSRAESARDAAEESASNAGTSAEQASSSASGSAQSAEAAETAKSAAVSASQSAASSADSAAGSAASAQASAENSATSAESAQTSAQEAQSAAEQAHIDVATETNARTIADAALQRSLDMLWKLNKGISYVFEQDTAEAYSKAIPSGAVVGDVQMVGGKSVVFNQLNKNPIYRNTLTGATDNHDGTISLNFRSASSRIGVSMGDKLDTVYFDGLVLNHRYLFYVDASVGGTALLNPQAYKSTQISAVSVSGDDSFKRCSCVCVCTNLDSAFCFYLSGDLTYPFTFAVKPAQLFDLTATFGSAADSITTYEQAKAAYAAIGIDIEQYHPYTPPTIISADVENVELCGKNIVVNESIIDKSYYSDSYGKLIPNSNMYALNPIKCEKNTTYTISANVNMYSVWQSTDGKNGISGTRKFFASRTYTITTGDTTEYLLISGNKNNGALEYVQVERGDVATEHTHYRPPVTIPIPAAIRSLPGYGWSGNTVDFAAKKYIQTVAAQSIGEDGRLAQKLYPVPVETDISAMLDDSFDSIEVEPGGSIEFKQGGDYRLPVPNREEYLISVAEVSR